MKQHTFPETVKKGNSIVTIYRWRNGEYDQFKVAYYFRGARKSETFSAYKKAKKRASEINDSVNDGNAETLSLTSLERLEYTQAKELLKPLGISLGAATMNFVDAQQLLGTVPLLRAAQYYLQKNPIDVVQKTTGEVVKEFLKAKRDRGVSVSHFEKVTWFLSGRLSTSTYKGQIKCLAASFPGALASIGATELSQFLDSWSVGPRTRNNKLTFLREFFNFAKKRKYLAADWAELDAIERRKVQDSEVEVYTPSEVALLLSGLTDDRVKVVVAICAFAGMRLTEVLRLDWAQVGTGGGKFIEVKGRTAKTRQRRLVPLSENLKAWIAPHMKPAGKVWPLTEESFDQVRRKQVKAFGFKLKNNALRHSYISYRMAQTSDAAKVSLEAGNTPDIIFRHYRELVSIEDAEKWFAIVPGKPGNVIDLKQPEPGKVLAPEPMKASAQAILSK